MKFDKIQIDDLIGALCELPCDWLDEKGESLLKHVRSSVAQLRRLKRKPTAKDFEAYLREDCTFLDVCRLFMGVAQEPAAHLICEHLQMRNASWSGLRSLCKRAPDRMAEALVRVGLPADISQQLKRAWSVEDVLIERYKMSRGRAIAGQKRGRGLEEDVEKALRETGVPFQVRVTFTGRKGIVAKCDFAIPTRNDPQVVIEAKGFEATGSKLTDFLGDVLKIGQAKQYHMYFFVVTDGRGWLNRKSDLQALVQHHHDGLVDMIYTRSELPKLAEAVKHIYQNE